MKSDIIEQIRLQSERSFEEIEHDEFSRIKEKYVIDANVDYPDPEYLISIGDIPTLPKGNLVAVTAKWKNGKTFLCDILAAIFLGSKAFGGCENLIKEGKVHFIDTEQARNDSARILKTIRVLTPENRHDDVEVSCLRNADIDDDSSDDISRYQFVKRCIEIEHPDLVIVDGVADLIYNYNDVNESQEIVKNLAALANEHNCCIIVVMHQNKGLHDKTMKGHIGTMLYQKCSDVFQVEKHGPIFEVSHPVSRHRQCGGLVFKLDSDTIPEDATADRLKLLEIEKQQAESKLRDMLADLIPKDGTPVRRSDIVDQLVENHPFKKAKAYNLLNQAIQKGWLVEVDRSTVRMMTESDNSTESPTDSHTMDE